MFAGGKEKIVVWTRRRSSKVLPCREANDRKAKLPKFEQSVFKFLSYLPRTTLLCMENLCAEEPTRSQLRLYFVSSPLNSLSVLHLVATRFLVGSSAASRLLKFRTQRSRLECLRRQVPQKRRVKTYKGKNLVEEITQQLITEIKLYYKITCRSSNRLFS